MVYAIAATCGEQTEELLLARNSEILVSRVRGCFAQCTLSSLFSYVDMILNVGVEDRAS